MSLSICLLTRNEEKNLPRVLGSIAGLAADVVVADTGSTDGTAALAQKLGARVCHWNWSEDFSAGRNYALDLATGDWVLWLNPDEELPASAHGQVRACIAREEAFAYGVVVQSLTRADLPDVYSTTTQIRLFRRHPEVRYAGRLHPNFALPMEELAAREGKLLLPSAIVVRHHAYLSQVSEEKLRWAVRLLELELRDRPMSLHSLIEYGRNLLMLNEPKGHAVLAEAAEKLAPFREAGQPPTPTIQRLLEYLMTVSPAQSASPLSREEARELAARWFPDSPPLLWRDAEISFAEGDFRRAAPALERLVQCGRTGLYDQSESFDPSILGAPALMNLGACYTRLEEWDKAEGCFRQLLQDRSHGPQALNNLKLVHEMRLQAVRRGDVFWSSQSF